MAYTNSPLVVYTGLSPNHSGQRTHSIDRITPHCVVGQLSAETICACFPAGREASCNYGIGTDGRISLCVEEKNRSWCTSSNANDQRAITIECASDKTSPHAMTDSVYSSLIKLCTDICKRNGKTKLLWFADKDKTLNYNPKADEMVLTVHRWFANKSCPGDWLYTRLGDVAAKVTTALATEINTTDSKNSHEKEAIEKVAWYRVRKSWSDSKSQLGAYKILNNAKACADKNKGYYVFDSAGKKIYPTENTTTYKCPFKVKVSIPDLIIRKGAGTNYGKAGYYTGIGVFTITEVKTGAGSTKGWGKLKSGAGWISLDFCTII